MTTGRGTFWLTVCLVVACFGVATRDAQCSRKHSKVFTANGGPIRKVAISAGSPDMTRSAAMQLVQNTCLTVVSNPKQADAVLQVGIALPSLNGGGGAPAPDMFGPSAQPQTMGGDKSKPQRSISASCSDSGGGGCNHSYKGFGGAGVEQPSSEWAGNGGARLDVSLTQPGNASNELWESNPHQKKSWSAQLRRAAGCPVCPGKHFDARKYSTYRNWIQTECPSVLAAH